MRGLDRLPSTETDSSLLVIRQNDYEPASRRARVVWEGVRRELAEASEQRELPESTKSSEAD